jgi:FkbM family methyltransferase
MKQLDSQYTQQTIPVTWSGLKVAVSQTVTYPPLGRMIAWWYKGLIPFHQSVVDIRGLDVPWRNVAAMYWGLYESAEYRFVRDYLSPNLPTIELGSSLGAIASVIARRLLPGQRLLCVEANPRLVKAVERTLARNAPHLRTEVLNAAIAYGAKATRFQVTDDNLCSSVDAGTAAHVVEVPAVTLQSLVERLHACEYQLVADIEGAESEILRHDTEALSRCRIAILELHNSSIGGLSTTPGDLVELLRRNGFGRIVRYGPVVVCRRDAPACHGAASVPGGSEPS